MIYAEQNIILYTGGLQPGICVPPGSSEDIFKGMLKHRTEQEKLKKNIS
jgi:hypothetical protein